MILRSPQRTLSIVSLILAIFALPTLASAQITYHVSPTGDDLADGSEETPWQTMKFACLRLSPGDTLIVDDGEYLDEGVIQIRYVNPETYEYLPLLGDEDHRTVICSKSCNSKIYGEFDLRGSFISIIGLEVIGDGESNPAGIGVFESMEIGIYGNIVHNHGGGGINFNQSDLIEVCNNYVYGNAHTNPSQHSGISVYQPVVRKLDGTLFEGGLISEQISNRVGVKISGNVCFGNENIVPTTAGDFTDGNGIIVDDYLYTQPNELLIGALVGTGGPYGFAGTPMIDLDEAGAYEPYARRTLINRNVTFLNGGRGIHAYIGTKVTISRNVSFYNLQSQALQDGLYRDEDGVLSVLNAEISLSDSDNCVVRRNLAISYEAEKAAAAESFYNLAPESGISTNVWTKNIFINKADANDSVSVIGAESMLLPLGN